MVSGIIPKPGDVLQPFVTSQRVEIFKFVCFYSDFLKSGVNKRSRRWTFLTEQRRSLQLENIDSTDLISTLRLVKWDNMRGDHVTCRRK